MELKTVALLTKPHDPNVASTVRTLYHLLRSEGLTVLPDASCRAHLPEHIEVIKRKKLLEKNPEKNKIDWAIVVGGDGTLLDAARSFAPLNIPILGVNLGRLGFMVDVSPDSVHQVINEVLDGNYQLEPRQMLEAYMCQDGERKGPFYALNEVVVRSRDLARMLEFSSHMDGQFISQHWADGIIISTPTGSTAYALSSGGPVMHPKLQALALVPICPHTLTDRPLVIPNDAPIEISVQDATAHPPAGLATFSCDGQIHHPLNVGDRVEIHRAPFVLNLIHPDNYDYFGVLRSKLKWGRGPRQTW